MEKENIAIGVIGTGFGKMIAKNFKEVCPSCKVFLAGAHKDKTEKVAEEISADGIFSTWQELAKSMKYMAKALVEAVKTNTPNVNFCTLKQAKENLEAFEKFK